MIVIIGDNNSGKSIYAEQLISQYDNQRFYIATLIPQSDDDHQRVDKHLKQRANLGFTTLEIPYDLSQAKLNSEAVVLLEDVSNLLANNLFDRQRQAPFALEEILSLSKRCHELVIVTIGNLDEAEFEGETKNFIAQLNWLNQQLIERANQVITMPFQEQS